MTHFARAERLSLAALLRTLGPDEPTLCEGWQTRDLAVHLVIRDRKPLAAAGTIAPGLGSRWPALGRHAANTVDELEALPWEKLVGMLAAGPPAWNPASWGPVDELMNTSEFLVHHEDVRRAQPDWQPRDLTWDLHARCYTTAKSMLLPVSLKGGRHLVLEAPGFGTASAGPQRRGSTTLRGTPVELLLWLFGRRDHVRLQISE